MPHRMDTKYTDKGRIELFEDKERFEDTERFDDKRRFENKERFEDMDETRYKLISCNNNNGLQKIDELDYGNECEKETYRITSKGVFAQCILTGAVMLSSAGCGMPIGYSAILLPQLKASNGTLQIDDQLGSWIASMHSAATPFGSLLSGVLMDYYGRKLAVQISSLPLIIGWMLIAFSPNHGLLLTGRVIAGLSVGLIAAPGQVLIGEISEPHLRGIFTSIPFGSYSFGILLVYALGSWLEWRIVAGLSTILPIIAAIAFFFLPESPVWLVRKGRNEEARLSLSWFRGGDITKTKMEMQQLVARVENEFMEQAKNKKSAWQILSERRILKPFLIINIFNFMQTFSGTYLVVFYAVDIISHIGGGNMDNFLAAVLTACVRFMFTIVSTVLLGIIGRRGLAMSSGIGTAVSAISLAVFLYFPAEVTSSYSYVAAICLFFYVAFNTIGFMILPGVLLGELYPAKERGFLGGLTFMVFHFTLFGTAKVFPSMNQAMGINGVFMLFGVTSVVASVFLYLILPETKGLSLNQIEDYFAEENITWTGRDKKWNNINNNNENAKA